MRLTIPAFLMLMHTIVAAQMPLSEESLVPDMAIKVSPLHLLNFYPTIDVAYEQRIRPRFTVQLGFGYVLDVAGDEYERYQNKNGFKLKLEGRHYFGAEDERNRTFYTSLEPYMNAIDFDRRTVVQ